MHRDLKQLLNIIIIPTIFWGLLLYLIFEYLYHGDMTLDGFRADIIFPFWVAHLFLLIGYISSMTTAYVVYRIKDVSYNL